MIISFLMLAITLSVLFGNPLFICHYIPVALYEDSDLNGHYITNINNPVMERTPSAPSYEENTLVLFNITLLKGNVPNVGNGNGANCNWSV